MKKILISFACLMGAASLQAQDMKRIFVDMPDSISVLMTKVNREDCVDFLANKMKAKVQNRFDRTSEVLTLTDDYLLAHPAANTTWEMRRLPLSDSTSVVCMVTTVGGPVKDSSVKFYSTSWKELPLSSFVAHAPAAADFYLTPSNKEEADSLQILRNLAIVPFLEARLSEKDNSLSYYYNAPEYMGKDDAERIKRYLRQSPIVYEWKEGRFVRVKD